MLPTDEWLNAHEVLCAVAQSDSPLTEPASYTSFESIVALRLSRTNCPLLVFDSNGVITLERMPVWCGANAITCFAGSKRSYVASIVLGILELFVLFPRIRHLGLASNSSINAAAILTCSNVQGGVISLSNGPLPPFQGSGARRFSSPMAKLPCVRS